MSQQGLGSGRVIRVLKNPLVMTNITIAIAGKFMNNIFLGY